MTPEDPPTDDEKESKDVTEYSGTIEIPNLSEENEPEEIDVSVPSHMLKKVCREVEVVHCNGCTSGRKFIVGIPISLKLFVSRNVTHCRV